MNPPTYGALIRTYADGVEAGSFDTDLDDVTRVYVVRLLHAGITGGGIGAHVIYPPADGSRDDVSAAIHRAASAGTVGLPLSTEVQYRAAIVRAVDIIRGI